MKALVGGSVVLSALAAVLGAFLGFVPTVAAWSFAVMATGMATLGSVLASVSIWFTKSSDEPYEMYIWGAISLAALGAVGYIVYQAYEALTLGVFVVLILVVLAGITTEAAE